MVNVYNIRLMTYKRMTIIIFHGNFVGWLLVSLISCWSSAVLLETEGLQIQNGGKIWNLQEKARQDLATISEWLVRHVPGIRTS